MSCAACSARVERAVGSLEGVDSCSVNLLSGDMQVSGSASRELVIKTVIAAGYGVADNKTLTSAKADKDTRRGLYRLIGSLVIVTAIMYLSMGHMIGLADPFAARPILNALLQMILALTVMIINRRFFISGFKAALHLAPNMDTLVSLGSLASFGYSLAILTVMLTNDADASHHLHGLYFESAAMILALISLGKTLESRAKGKTTSALEGLISLKGKYATLLVCGEEKTVSVDDIQSGDIFVVRAGESIPTDGEIVFGSGAVDESMLTGESLPRDVSVGDTVYGGSINSSGYIKVRATKVGEGTVLANIIRLVEEASSSKAPIAKLADKVSSVFVPSVLAISLLTLVGWLIAKESFGFAIARAISVLVISCPCALGLATPVAIMVGSGVGARNGVLFKTAAALEESGRVKTVVLDKTGTLTVGEPMVTDVICEEKTDAFKLLSLAYSIEKMSEHPLGKAIASYAENKERESYTITDFKSLAGRGVYGKTNGKDLFAVSFAMASEICNAVPTELAKKLSDEGKTPIAILYDGEYLGAIALGDRIKPDAKECVLRLQAMGIDTVMLSGDNERTANAIAKEIGIDRVIAGVLPDGKEAVIRALMRDGKVAMVGDGINDAPALTAADVGIAIGRGTDIAIDSADVVAMGNGVCEVADAIGIGRSTLRNIKENLFWAFLYNCIGIPLAIGLFGLRLSPMIGAAMMSLSSFSVVMNALRLNMWKPKRNAENTDICKESVTNTTENTIDNKENSMTVIINVEGMMCPHCEARVKKVCEAIDGVTLATASHKDGTVTVEMTLEVTDKCKSAIVDAGYDVK